MVGLVMRSVAGYVKTPLMEQFRVLREWIIRVIAKRRVQRLRKCQKFPERIKSILVVCKGNICRSPLAEAYLRKGLAKCGLNVSVFSAGLETSVGKQAHNFALMVGRSAGIPLDGHATRPLIKEHVESADLIVVMEHAHYQRLLKLYPSCQGKTFLLRQFSQANETRYDKLEIADPYSGTLRDFDECFAIISQSCDELISEICRDLQSNTNITAEKT